MTLRTGTSSKRRRPAAGFTLVELTLVVLLIAVLTGLSVPLLKGASADLALKDTSFNITQMIGYAQEMTLLDKESYALNLDPEKATFWLTRSGAAIKGRAGKVFRLPRGIKMESEKTAVFFYPDGRADDAEIKLTGKSAAGKVIRVNGLLNEVEVKDLEPE